MTKIQEIIKMTEIVGDLRADIIKENNLNYISFTDYSVQTQGEYVTGYQNLGQDKCEITTICGVQKEPNTVDEFIEYKKNIERESKHISELIKIFIEELQKQEDALHENE